MNAKAALAALKEFHNPKKAVGVAKFFQTGKGQYGEGDIFWGLTVPLIRSLAKDFRHLPVSECLKLLKHEVHEARLLALILLVNHYADRVKSADAPGRDEIFAAYLAHTRFINNWDLVDSSASYIVGKHLSPRDTHLLETLAESPLLWERRIAIIATHAYIKGGELRPTLKIATLLLHDEHDLIHKAVGWMLRELGKSDEPTLHRFLKKHHKSMPRTALRYAIERLTPAQRAAYMAK